MTVEPHEAYSVCIRAPIPERERTLADYQAPIIARYGYLPSMQELSKRENSRARADTYQPESALGKSLEQRRAKQAHTLDTLVSCITRPMTSQDISTATGVPYSTVSWMMLRALEEGRVRRTRAHRIYIWEQADAPDYVAPPAPIKPASPDAIPVTVRGVTLPSMRACAKHFNISVQAVQDAVRRGSTDKIGSRKRVAG